MIIILYYNSYKMTTGPHPRPRNMKEMQYELLEEGRLSYEDAYTLDLVTKQKIPYDEYQELVADRRNHHSRMTRFAVQVAISGTVMAFTIAMLAVGKPEGVYLPVLTGILGYWLPAPDSSKLRTPKSASITPNNTSTTTADINTLNMSPSSV